MGNEIRDFLRELAGPGRYAGFWKHGDGEDAYIAARDELRALGMAEDRIVPFLKGLFLAGMHEGLSSEQAEE